MGVGGKRGVLGRRCSLVGMGGMGRRKSGGKGFLYIYTANEERGGRYKRGTGDLDSSASD